MNTAAAIGFIGADSVAHLDRLYSHFILVVHHRHLIAALQLRNCTLRHKQRALLDSGGRANPGVAAGAQDIARIRK